MTTATMGSERKGLTESDVHSSFLLSRDVDGCLCYGREELCRNWGHVADSIGSRDQIGPFGQVRRSLLAGQRDPATADGTAATLLESEDGQYALFVPNNLLRPLFAHRWFMTKPASALAAALGARGPGARGLPFAAHEQTPALAAGAVEMDLATVQTKNAGARPSLSQLRELLGSDFRHFAPFFVGADASALFSTGAAGRPDLNFLRHASAALQSAGARVDWPGASGPSSTTLSTGETVEVLRSGQGHPEVVLDRLPAMPPGKVAVPFHFSGAGYLEYGAPSVGSTLEGPAGRVPPKLGVATGENINLRMSVPGGAGREGLWYVRSVVDLLNTPLGVSNMEMYLAPPTQGGAARAIRTAWSADDNRVVWDGERYAPVVEVQRRARSVHSRPDHCLFNYSLDYDERLVLDGVDVTSVLAGRGRYRDVRASAAQEHESHHHHGYGLSDASPEAAVVRVVKEIAAERRRRASVYRGGTVWEREAAMDDATEAFDPRTGRKLDERHIWRDTGVGGRERPLQFSEFGKLAAPAPGADRGEVKETRRAASPTTPEIFYQVLYMLPTQVPLRPYGAAAREEGPAGEAARWSAWAGAGPEAIYLNRAAGGDAGFQRGITAGGRRGPSADEWTAGERAADEALFDRPGVRGGGALKEGFNRDESKFLFKGDMGARGAGVTSAIPAGGGLGGELSFAGSLAAAALAFGEPPSTAEKLRAMPMSTARGEMSIGVGTSGEPVIKYRAPELSALKSTLDGRGFDLAAPPPLTRPEKFEATSSKKGMYAGGAAAGATEGAAPGAGGGEVSAHVTGPGGSRTVRTTPSDLGFVPGGAEKMSRFSGVTGGVAPAAAGVDAPGMELAKGAARGPGMDASRVAMMVGGGAMAAGFGGAAVAAGLSSDGTRSAAGGGDSASTSGDSPRKSGRAAAAGGGSLFLDYSPTDRTLYLSRVGKGESVSGSPDMGVAMPEGLTGSLTMSERVRGYVHTAKADRDVPGSSGMAAGWVGGAVGTVVGGGAGGAAGAAGASTSGVGGGGTGPLNPAALGLASAVGGVPGAGAGAKGAAGGPPLAEETMVKFMGPQLSYQLGHDADGKDVLVYSGSMGASASGYPGAETGMEFALPLATEQYSSLAVGDSLEGNLRVAWAGKDGAAAGVKDLHEVPSERRPGLHAFPMNTSFSLGTMTGLFGSGVAGGGAEGLARKAQAEHGLKAAGASAYRGSIDSALAGRGPAMGPAQFDREVESAVSGLKGGLGGAKSLLGGGGAGGLGMLAGAGGGGAGMGGLAASLGLMGTGGLGGGALGAGPGGAAAGGPGAAGKGGAAGAGAPDKVVATPHRGLDVLKGHDASFNTSVSLADLSAQGPAYGIRREDLVGLQKSLASSGSYTLKAPGFDLVVARPAAATGDGAVPESVILHGKRVEAHTGATKRNPAGASSENKVNLDYEVIAREIYKRIKNLAALQRERRADDHMRYG